MLHPKVVNFLQNTPGAIFQNDISCNVLSAEYKQFLPWSVCSPNMSTIEHVRNFVDRRLTHYPSPIAIAENFFECTFKWYGVFVPRQTFKIGLIPCHTVWKHLLMGKNSILNTASGYFILLVCFVNVINFYPHTSRLCITINLILLIPSCCYELKTVSNLDIPTIIFSIFLIF